MDNPIQKSNYQKMRRHKKESLKKWIAENSRLFDGVSRFKNLRIFQKKRQTGIITDIERVSPDDLMRPLGCLRVRFSTHDGQNEVFQTKLRKGMKFRPGQHVMVETLHLPASAWSYEFNVVRIDVEGKNLYKWSPRDILFSFARC